MKDVRKVVVLPRSQGNGACTDIDSEECGRYIFVRGMGQYSVEGFVPNDLRMNDKHPEDGVPNRAEKRRARWVFLVLRLASIAWLPILLTSAWYVNSLIPYPTVLGQYDPKRFIPEDLHFQLLMTYGYSLMLGYPVYLIVMLVVKGLNVGLYSTRNRLFELLFASCVTLLQLLFVTYDWGGLHDWFLD